MIKVLQVLPTIGVGRADKVVSHSIEKAYKIKGFPLIPNGIPTKKYIVSEQTREDYRKMLNIAVDEVVFVSVARLAPEKDHLTLIRAFHNLSKVYKNTKLLLVVNGPLREELKQEVKERKINDGIIFLGIRKDIPEILSASDVFVL